LLAMCVVTPGVCGAVRAVGARFVLQKGAGVNRFSREALRNRVELAEAKAGGIPVIAYGQFINDVIGFIIVAFVIFLIVKRANRLWSDEPAEAEEPTTKNCPFCVSAIPVKATRCPECTSQLQPA
ncbi:MAG TPA: MscL family protein, partial [Pyrinomonadaceae bacterium]